jgi:hypothetical protein
MHPSPQESPTHSHADAGATFLDTPARQQLIAAAQILRPVLCRSSRRLHRDAWATIETYIAVSLRVLDNMPFEAIKSAAVTEEIKARLDGRPV